MIFIIALIRQYGLYEAKLIILMPLCHILVFPEGGENCFSDPKLNFTEKKIPKIVIRNWDDYHGFLVYNPLSQIKHFSCFFVIYIFVWSIFTMFYKGNTREKLICIWWGGEWFIPNFIYTIETQEEEKGDKGEGNILPMTFVLQNNREVIVERRVCEDKIIRGF